MDREEQMWKAVEQEHGKLTRRESFVTLTAMEWADNNRVELCINESASISKRNPKSVINWQTGEPKESGEYLVTLEDGSVCRDEWRELYCEDDIKCWVYNEGEVVAWCKLSDIEPYKQDEV